MNAFTVVHKGKVIDTVFFNTGCDLDYVRSSLVNHDGYPSDIEVFKGR